MSAGEEGREEGTKGRVSGVKGAVKCRGGFAKREAGASPSRGARLGRGQGRRRKPLESGGRGNAAQRKFPCKKKGYKKRLVVDVWKNDANGGDKKGKGLGQHWGR